MNATISKLKSTKGKDEALQTNKNKKNERELADLGATELVDSIESLYWSTYEWLMMFL